MDTVNLEISRIRGRKRNAWLLHLSSAPTLFCGDNVEVRACAFFEGAWTERFSDFEFASSADVFGTGAVLTPEGWLLVPPTHTIEAIYALRKTSGVWTASNSLAFLKKFSGFQFLESNSKLVRLFIGIADGIKSSPARTSTSEGTLFVLHHYNALVARDGLIVRPKSPPPQFTNFTEYREYLSKTVLNVAENAAAPERSSNYKLLATISSGYDSPACAVLARAASCEEAITILSSRDGEGDDGTPIGEKLGLKVTQFPRPEPVGEDRKFVAEMFSTGTQGEDMVYEPLRGKLNQKILITGFHGDKIWDKKTPATPFIKRGDISGASLAEFRLSESFVHLPAPFIGVSRHQDIELISNSQEMQSYSIGGTYDRPIPRRIVEDAGIDRKLFAQSKKAIVILAFLDKSQIPKRIRDEIQARFGTLSWLKKLIYLLDLAKFSAERFLLGLSYRISSKLKISSTQSLVKLTWLFVHRGRSGTVWEHSHPYNGLALEWALSVVSEEYQLENHD